MLFLFLFLFSCVFRQNQDLIKLHRDQLILSGSSTYLRCRVIIGETRRIYTNWRAFADQSVGMYTAAFFFAMGRRTPLGDVCGYASVCMSRMFFGGRLERTGHIAPDPPG